MVPIPETEKKKRSQASSPAKPRPGKNRHAGPVHNNTSQVQHAPSNIQSMDDKCAPERSRQNLAGNMSNENGVHMTMASDSEEQDGGQKEAKAARAAARRAQFLLKAGENRISFVKKNRVCVCVTVWFFFL
jgi:hypothetical protein